MKENESSIDVLKTLAICGVVAIHFLGGLEQLDKTGIYHEQYFVWDQIMRFCVPLFVMLSGFTLGRRYFSELKVDFKSYFVKRINRTVPLYIFWTVIILALGFLIPTWGQFFAGASLLQIFLLGRADYQLYFVPMVFQLYLFFPLLLFLVKKIRFGIVLIAFFVQALLFIYVGRLFQGISGVPPFLSDQEQYIFFGSWIFYFVLGMYLGINDFKLQTFGKKINLKFVQIFCLLILLTITLFGVNWAILDMQKLIISGSDPLVATRFTRLPILLYATGFILTVNWLRQWISKLPAFILKLLSILGKHSYLIFLCHTIWLRILFAIINKDVKTDLLIPAIVITFFGVVASLYFSKSH